MDHWQLGWSPEQEAIEFEASRTNAVVPPKSFAEIAHGSEATLVRQFLGRESTLSDHMHGMLQTNEAKESPRRDPPSPLEQSREVKSAHLRDACHVRDADGTRVMLTAEFLDLDDE